MSTRSGTSRSDAIQLGTIDGCTVFEAARAARG